MKTNPSLADVAQRRQTLEAEIAARQRELEELEIAERVLHRLGALMEAAPAAKPVPAKIGNAVAEPAKESIESLILILLSDEGRVWWTANELQVELSRLKGTEVPMSTVSPTLSNMKNKDKIAREGMRVALPERANTMDGETERMFFELEDDLTTKKEA
jgi:hypothetical protein